MYEGNKDTLLCVQTEMELNEVESVSAEAAAARVKNFSHLLSQLFDEQNKKNDWKETMENE